MGQERGEEMTVFANHKGMTSLSAIAVSLFAATGAFAQVAPADPSPSAQTTSVAPAPAAPQPESVATPAAQADAQDKQEGGAPDAAGPAANDFADGEVVVTAQRREERLKDVPISVTAVSGAQLAASGISGSRDLATLAPGVTINTTGAAAQATVRGIGNTIVGGNSESPVALYIDGVYISGQYFAVFDLADIDSVQVLKGPQGTLFGRNATGGAILVTTSRPKDVWTGKISASYGRFNDRQFNGFISGPLTDNLSFGIAGNYHKDHGYARDALRGTHMAEYFDKSLRAKLEFSPDADTSILLIGDYGRVYDEAAVSLKPYQKPSTVGAFVPTDPRELAATFDSYSINKGKGLSLEIKHDFGPFTLKSITAYRETHNYSLTDQDRVVAAVSRIDTTIDDKYLTQEVTLANSKPGAFQWIVGGFYFGDTTTNPTLSNGALLNNSKLNTDAWALFGEGTYAFTDHFKLTAGVRYSSETRTALSRRTTGTPLTAFRTISADSWTPRLSLIYAINDASNVYATFSKGFKSGVFPGATFNAPAVEPETIDAYEVGYKLAKGGTSFNLAGFYYNYDELQVTTRTPAGLQSLLNAAAAKIYGVDADFSTNLGSGFRLRLAGAYTKSEYKDFTTAPIFTPLPAGGNATTSGDATGNPLIRTPKFTGTASLRYETPVGNNGKVDASLDYYYNSGFSWTVDNNYREDAYNLVNAQIGWSPDGRFRISAFGKNLTNALYAMGVSVTGLATAAAYARPRTYGVAASFKF
jgi:iron complex outermembrane receptor protein